MTKNFWLICSLILGLIVFGLFTVNNEPILLAIPFLIYLGFAIANQPSNLQLILSRELSTHNTSWQKPVEVKVNITNQGKFHEEIFLQDFIRGTGSLSLNQGHLNKKLSIQEGDSTSLEYIVSGNRGRYTFEGMQANSCETFGLFERVRFYPADTQLSIFPVVIPLRSIRIHPRETRGFAGPILARQGGAGTDFFGVREYQLGDPMRRINWKISSRYPQSVFTNETEQERIADVGIILDARQQCDIRTKDGSLFEYSVIAAASLADSFLKDGHRVGLYIYGYSVDRVFPGYGKIQRENILKALSRAHTGINFALENLSFLSSRFFPPKTQLIMVSPLKPEDLNPLVRLHSLGYELLIVSPDPVHFEAMKYSREKHPDLDLAFRLSIIERTLLIRRLKRAGIDVIDWQVNYSLDQVVHRSIRKHAAGDRILQIAL
jgi:uncharacterized protein (DUF58 family)